MKHRIIFFFIAFTIQSFSQNFTIERIEPPNWWVGMKMDTIQILVYGKNIGEAEIYPQHGPIEIINTHKASSPNYLFIDLAISPEIKTNYNFEIGFSKGNMDTVISYPILLRENLKINSKDLINLM